VRRRGGKPGDASLLSPRVSCSGALPSVGTFQRSETYFVASRSSRCTATASQVPSGDGATAVTRFSAMCCSTVYLGSIAVPGIDD
jgi:hypothetical protein